MRSIMLFLLALACGCAQQTTNTSRDSAARVFVLPGFSIEAPSEFGWVVQTADSMEAVLQKGTADSSVRLVAYAIATDSFADDQTFLKFAEARQEAAHNGLQMVSKHFDYTRFKGAMCLPYSGIFHDTLAISSERQFLNTRGYFCRHPTAVGQAVGLEYTQRSVSRTPPDMEHTLEVVEDFFNSVVFTNAEHVR